MNRKIFYWKLRSTELQLGERTLIMGVLNITPDSFSDGGNFSDPDRAYARALEMEEQGVDIIDIGAESTRPDSKRISADEEWQRLVPVLKRLKDKLRVPISIDTYKSETAERALEYGVEILNDPSGLTFDADLAKVAVAGNAGLILNHMRGLPETWAKQAPMQDVMGNIGKDLEATVSRARRMGVDKNRIMIDPGIGFGKRKEQNSEILAGLAKLTSLDLPILVGPSRKAFLAQATEGDTVHATAAAVAVAILNGAHVVRVHDVKEMRIVAQITDDIVRAGAAAERPALEAAERQVSKGARKESQPYLGDERHVPTRPPLAKPAAPVVPISEAPAADTPEPEFTEKPVFEKPVKERFAPAARKRVEDSPIVRRPPQDRPSKGWESDRPQRSGPPAGRPSYGGGDRGGDDRRPPFRGGQDRPSFGDRGGQGRPPFRREEERPAARDGGGRPPFRDAGGKPPYRGGSDRPSYGGDRGGGGGRPPFRGGADRPSYGGGGGKPPFRGNSDRPDRPSYGGPDRGGGGKPPYRGGSERGGSDRPSFGGGGAGRPPRGDSGGRPPQGGAPRRPFRKRP